MLRHNDTIRLTSTERAAYAPLAALSGMRAAPETVQEYNAGLAYAAQTFEQGDSAEEQLAALLVQDQMVN